MPIDEDDPRWEPLGFNYLCYLKDNRDDAIVKVAFIESEKGLAEELEPHEEEIDEDEVDALDALVQPSATQQPPTAAAARRRPTAVAQLVAVPVLTPALNAEAPAEAPAEAVRKHGRFSRTSKALGSTPQNSSPIETQTPTERQLMAEALTDAMRQHRGASDRMYDLAAEFYLAKATIILHDSSKAPPPDLRPRTSGALLKAAAERCMRFQRRVAQEQELHEQERCLALGEQGDAALAEQEPHAEEIASIIMSLRAREEEEPPNAALPCETLSAGGKRKRGMGESSAAKRNAAHNKAAREASFEVRRDEVRSLTSRKLNRVARSDLLREKVTTFGRSMQQIADGILDQWPDAVASILVQGKEQATHVETAVG